MGYGSYTLPDGREAGYLVDAECDADGCATVIDRGLGYLCGEMPDGHRDPDDHGCGRYFCGEHERQHDCPAPACEAYDVTENLWCHLREGHDDEKHQDPGGETFEAVDDE